LLSYVVRRLLVAVPVLFFVSIIVFSLIHLLPGDPAISMLGEEARPELIQALRKDLGLDQPLYQQYFSWLRKGLSGDMGRSIQTKQSVAKALGQRLPVTIELTFLAFVIAIVISIPLAIGGATRPNSWIDFFGSVFAAIGISMPSFWLGILLIYLFAMTLHWLPASGYVSIHESLLLNLKHMALPAITLGMWLSASVMRLVRSAMAEVLDQDYIRTARSMGLPERFILWTLALKNVLVPVVTILGLQIGRLMGGAVVTETIFALPGIGRLAVHSIFTRDYPPVQAVVLVMAVSVLLTSLIVDLLYSFLNPRMRYGD
jgi:peptide/nickel transport system permease protein